MKSCLFYGTTMAAAIAVAAPLAATAAPVTFSDTVLDPASYDTVIYNTDPSVDVTVSQLASGGNPGSALQILFTNVGGAVDMTSLEGFINTSFSYDPASQGALASLAYSNDRYVDAGPAVNASLVTLSRPLISQGGHYYVSPISDVQLRQTWFTTATSSLTAADFSEISFATGVTDGSSHPDFSATGSTLSFGFANRFVLGTGGAPTALDAEFRYDNIAYALTAAAVPEPSAVAMMLAGLACFVGVRRRSARA